MEAQPNTELGVVVDSSVDWSSLPNDLLDQIYKYITDPNDDRSFSTICKNWRSFVISSILKHQILPRLMVPYYPRSVFSLTTTQVHALEDLPELSGKYCFGYSEGYLVFLENTSPSISLFNPITKNQIQLPPLTAFPDVLGFDISHIGGEYHLIHNGNGNSNGNGNGNDKKSSFFVSTDQMQQSFISKVLLSPNPKPNNYIAVAIFGFRYQKLAFCKSGYPKWSVVENNDEVEWTHAQEIGSVDDVIHYKGQFYVLTLHHIFRIACNLDDISRTVFLMVTFVVELPESITLEINTVHANYLVELSGELIVVVRHMKFSGTRGHNAIGCFTTQKFEVLKLDQDQSCQEWVTMQSIGDHALFVGANSVLASCSPLCRKNCIYFTTEFWHRYKRYCNYGDLKVLFKDVYASHDFGIFDMRRSIMEPLFPSPCRVQSFSYSQVSIWVKPLLSERF